MKLVQKSPERKARRRMKRNVRWLIFAACLIFATVILFMDLIDSEERQEKVIKSRLNRITAEILNNDEQIETFGYNDRYSLEKTLDISLGNTSFMAIEPESKRLLYFIDDKGMNHSGQTLTEAGLRENLVPADDKIISFNKWIYLVQSSMVETNYYGNMYIVAMGPLNLFSSWQKMGSLNLFSSWHMLFCTMLIFIFIIKAGVYYTLYLRTYHSTYNDRKKTRSKVLLYIAVSGAFMLVFCAITSRLFCITANRSDFSYEDDFVSNLLIQRINDSNSDFEELAEDYALLADELREDIETHEREIFDSSHCEKFLYRTVANDGNTEPCLDALGNPTQSVIRSPYLQSLAQKNGLSSIMLYDSNGRRIVSTDGEWNDMIAVGSEDREVLDRLYKYQFSQSESEFTFSRFITLHPYDNNGVTMFGNKGDEGVSEEFGLLRITSFLPDYYQSGNQILTKTLKESEDMLLCKMAFFSMENDEPKLKCISQDLQGESMTTLGLENTKDCFGGNYLGFTKIHNIECLVSCRYVANVGMFFVYYTPMSFIRGYHTFKYWHLPITLTTVVLLFLLCIAMTGFKQKNVDLLTGGADTYIEIIDEDEKRSFNQKGPEEKLLTILGNAVCIFIGLLCIYLVASIYDPSSPSVIRHILFGNWTRGVTLFSFTACCISLFAVITVCVVLKAIMSVLSQYASAKSLTVFKLVLSIIKYGSILAWIFYSLYLLGMDVKTVLTSLGAFSIMVGLAAQTLIRDFIAGFFIMMESQYKIGDIVQIGGYTGKVKEIGLKSTKFESWDGNITVISNSSINQITNLSKMHSCVMFEFTVGAIEERDRFEKVFRENQADIEARLGKLLLGHIEYDGVVSTDFSHQNCVLRFTADCREADRGLLKHKLADEIARLIQKRTGNTEEQVIQKNK